LEEVMATESDRDLIPAHWNRRLVCHLHSIELRGDGILVLILADGHCTNMSGAIELAEDVTKHMPGFGLQCVLTVGGYKWTAYVKVDNGDEQFPQIGKWRWAPVDSTRHGLRYLPESVAMIVTELAKETNQ
jgi:hypothetical protein